ncbi:MAG: hypothetical protein M3281_09605, partial [Chloroflexota bacterium]|nr:hypothetical protein [Chloroflexota bacterium]
YRDLSDDALVEQVAEAVDSVFGAPVPPSEVRRDLQYGDLTLLAGDRCRVWWRDLEGVFPGEELYLTTVTEWAAISRGAFAPQAMVERWQGPDGPAELEFMLDGRQHRVHHPNVHDDHLNIGIVRDINRLIAGTGYRFAVCDNLGMPNWITVLTSEERDQLRRDRGWSFLDL